MHTRTRTSTHTHTHTHTLFPFSKKTCFCRVLLDPWLMQVVNHDASQRKLSVDFIPSILFFIHKLIPKEQGTALPLKPKHTAPLKLRPYGAIQICLLLLLLLLTLIADAPDGLSCQVRRQSGQHDGWHEMSHHNLTAWHADPRVQGANTTQHSMPSEGLSCRLSALASQTHGPTCFLYLWGRDGSWQQITSGCISLCWAIYIRTYNVSLVPSLHSQTSQALQVSKTYPNRLKTNQNIN